MARAIKGSGVANPNAIRVMSLILVLTDSIRPLDRPYSIAARIESWCFTIRRCRATNASIRQRRPDPRAQGRGCFGRVRLKIGASPSFSRYDDLATDFSNANAAVDVAAPGRHPRRGAVRPREGGGTGCPAAPDGYDYESGTSFAAPMVSAAVAWIRAARPHLQADQAADVIRFSARDVGQQGYDGETGYGVLDVDHALALKKPPHDPDEPNDGPALIDGSTLGAAHAALFTGRRTGRRVPASTRPRTRRTGTGSRCRATGRRTCPFTPRSATPTCSSAACG